MSENLGLNSRVKSEEYAKESRIGVLEKEKSRLGEIIKGYEVKISSLESKN